MKQYLAHFTVGYVDININVNVCKGAVPFMADEGDEYFVAEAIVRGIPGATFEHTEEVQS